MKYQDFNKLFFALLVLHLAVIYRPDSMALYYISKPALVFSLLSFFLHKSEAMNAHLKLFFSLALGFSLLGDLVLMFEGDVSFLVGMGSFALAHLAYSIFYLKQKLKFTLVKLFASSTLSLIGIYALYQFVNVPVELAPYLYLFAFIIGLHLVISTGFIRSSKSSYMPSIGVLCLIISDFLLALNLFNAENLWLKMGVMLIYALGQYLIVIGVTKVFAQNEELETS